MKSKLLSRVWPFGAFVLLDAYSLRNALTTPGIVGHVWDWAVPALADQNLHQALTLFSSWDDWNNGGSFNPLKSLYYFLLTFPLGTFGGEFESKLLVFALPLASALGMYLLARKGLRLNRFWATLAGSLYMLSPITYSRLISGYLSLIAAQALLPVLVLACLLIPRLILSRSPSLPWLVVAAGFLLGVCQALHSSMFVIASFTAAVLLAIELTVSNAKKLVAASVVVFSLGVLLNFSWLASFGISYLSSGSLFHGGTTSKPTDLITLASVTDWRQNLLDSVSQPMYESIRMNAVNGVATEIEYPIPDNLNGIWTFASFLVPIAAFSLLLREKNAKPILALLILGLTGIVIVSGTRTVIGTSLLQFLKSYVPPFWAEFGSTPRAFPLVALAYAALAPLSLERLSELLGGSRPLRGFAASPAIVVGAAGVSLLVVWTIPFFSGDITQSNVKAIGLHLYTLDSEDSQLYAYLRNNPADSRMLVIPPEGYWGTTDYDWVWGVGNLPARPKFMAPVYNSLAWRPGTDLTQFSPNSRAGRLLGLAAVQDVVYSFAKLFPAAARESIDAVLAAEPDFKPVALPSGETKVFQNSSYLPRIYAADSTTSVLGSSDLLGPLSTTPVVSHSPALIFTPQQSDSSLALAILQSARTVEPIQTYPIAASALVTSSLQLDTQPVLAETRPVSTSADSTIQVISLPDTETSAAGTFRLALSADYVIRASTYAPVGNQVVKGQPAFAGLQDDLDDRFSPADWSATKATDKSDGLEWDTNTLYDERVSSSGAMDVRVLFTDSATDSPFVEFTESLKPFSLNEYPLLSVAVSGQDPGVQLVETWLGLDWNGDGVADDHWSLPIAPGAEAKTVELPIRDYVKQDYPGKADYMVVSVTIKLTRRPKLDPSRVSAGSFQFGIKGISFRSSTQPTRAITLVPAQAGQVSEITQPGCGCAQGANGAGLSFDFPGGGAGAAVNLRRDLPALDATADTTFSLDYAVDGPSSIDLDMALSGVDAQGSNQSVPLGTRVLAPFSSGTLVFTSPAAELKQSSVSLALANLLGEGAYRDTNVTLTRFRVSRSVLTPYSALDAPAPPIAVDGRPVQMAALPDDPDRSGHWFGSSVLSLAAGIHRITVGFVDSTTPYRVGLVEIGRAGTELAASNSAKPTTSFREVDPTRFVVHVEDAQAPFMLVFGESFQAGWQAHVVPGESDADSTWYEHSALASWVLQGPGRPEIADHYLVNGYANGWYVDQKGSYNIVIEFAPQRLYEAGLFVTILSPVLGLIVLLAVRNHRG